MAEFEIKSDYREDTLYMEWIGRLRADMKKLAIFIFI